MFARIKNTLLQHAANSVGWKTNRKLLVIESDDWGMIRMPSKEVYTRLLAKGYAVDRCIYNSNDCIESNEDLELLFEVLQQVKDKAGNPAVITANCIVANPNFQLIEKSAFGQYFFEPFTETLKKYPHHNRVYALHREGISKKLIYPQLHGREHLNVARWMKALQQNDADALAAFREEMFTVSKGAGSNCRKEWLDAFGAGDADELQLLDTIVADACTLFQQLWGYASTSVIAPCYIWHPHTEKILKEKGIHLLQGGRMQRIPQPEGGGYAHRRHFTGQKNEHNQFYLVRNAAYEPASNRSVDWVDSCLRDIKNAFHWGKPAVISCHRVNFIGSINPGNRSATLKEFTQLLHAIVGKWPDVEFVHSAAIAQMMLQSSPAAA